MKKPSLAVWIGFGLIVFLSLWALEYLAANLLPVSNQIEPDSFLNTLYPSLQAKLSHYGRNAILEYLGQIKFRGIALVGFFAYLLFSGSRPTLQSKETDLIWRIRLFFGVQLIYLPDLLNELTVRYSWRAFYSPLPLFGALIPSFPPIWILQFLIIFIFAIAAYFILTQWNPSDWLPSILGSLNLIFWAFLLIVFFGFGKIDHTYASLFSAHIFLVVWLLHWRTLPANGSFGHQIFQAGIWGCYFFSGLEKIFLSGIQWFGQNHFEVLYWLHPTRVGEWILHVPGLGPVLLFCAVIFQLSAVLLWRYPRWGYGFGIFAILFHLGTWVVLGVGGWQSPWILMALFLFPISNKNP